jgi:hypothetical protein
MEPGTDGPELVDAWRRVERRRRAGDRLAVGTALLLGGALAVLLGVAVPTRLCSVGAGYLGCVVSDPGTGVQVALLVGGAVALELGVLAYWSVFADDG